ncbi:Hsp20/alpha crystallin family protein [Rossellomorea marisflavi]|uniref:Hsp20/alpha crystallin family protein n=1 Tax=Rossellomorea marisflavi TaxID=189381 RepID=UPI00345DEEFF|nr:Hsp20/alpha crystallin family protein [Rossellomorea marisflavi]
MDSYVQDMMKKMFPGGFESMMNANSTMGGASPQQSAHQSGEDGSIPAHVFESFDDVYVRFELKDEGLMKKVKIYHTSNQAIIENIPSQGDRQVLTLPCLVKKKGASAHFRDGILEVKIPKSTDMQFTEIDVSDRY